MITIHKWRLMHPGRNVAIMPKGARVLSAGSQAGDVVVWAAVETGNAPVEHVLDAVPTGLAMPDYANVEFAHTLFIGSVLLAEGSLVYHIFDLGETE